MTKKELIKNKWFMRNDISLRETWEYIIDEYAEYVAREAWMYFGNLDFDIWYKQFKAKEDAKV
jgi:hypothetical protein